MASKEFHFHAFTASASRSNFTAATERMVKSSHPAPSVVPSKIPPIAKPMRSTHLFKRPELMTIRERVKRIIQVALIVQLQLES